MSRESLFPLSAAILELERAVMANRKDIAYGEGERRTNALLAVEGRSRELTRVWADQKTSLMTILTYPQLEPLDRELREWQRESFGFAMRPGPGALLVDRSRTFELIRKTRLLESYLAAEGQSPAVPGRKPRNAKGHKRAPRTELTDRQKKVWETVERHGGNCEAAARELRKTGQYVRKTMKAVKRKFALAGVAAEHSRSVSARRRLPTDRRGNATVRDD